MASVVLVAVVTFSKLGKMRIGGKEAKPKYSFWTWFAMTLTGGIATGIDHVGKSTNHLSITATYGENLISLA